MLSIDETVVSSIVPVVYLACPAKQLPNRRDLRIIRSTWYRKAFVGIVRLDDFRQTVEVIEGLTPIRRLPLLVLVVFL